MKHIYLKFAKTTFIKSLLGIVFLLGMQGMQAQVTSTATGGLWSATTTWVGGVVPVATDNVIIATSGIDSVIMDVNLTMTAGTSVTVNDGATLSVNAGVTSTFITLTANGTGICTNNGTLTVSTLLGGTGSFINATAASVLNLASTPTITTLTATFAGNTVNYAMGALAIKDTDYSNLTISNSGIKPFVAAVPRTITNLTLNTGAVFLLTGQLTVTTALTGLGTLNNASGGILVIQGTFTSATNMTNIGNTIVYNLSGSQTIRTLAYKNLVFSGSGTKTIGVAAAGTLCTGTLSILGTAQAAITNTGVKVNNLVIGGIGKAIGTYGATGSAATNIDDAAFTGTSGFLDVLNTTTTWDGSAWNNGAPALANTAIIEGTYSTTTNGAITANKLTVNSGSLTVNSGTNVTVANEVINNAGLNGIVIENNANLIQTNNVVNSGVIRVKRDSNTLSRLDYTIWSSPVNIQNLLDFSPATVATRFFNYDTTTNFYSTVASPSTTSFTVGKGTLIRMPNTAVDAPSVETFNGQFSGILNNGNVSVTLAYVSATQKYNMVGNPYASTINATTFINTNAVTNTYIEPTLYFWRKTNVIGGGGTAYATWTTAGGVANNPSGTATEQIVPNGTIQVGQGFIVAAKSAATRSSFFSNAMRVADNNNQFLKTKQVVERNRIWLNLSNTNGGINQMLVGYMADAVQGVDATDGQYINDSATALTSNIEGGEYVIQGRALPFDPSDIVALNFKAENAGTFTIAKDHADGLFASGQDIYLIDATTGTETNLQTNGYTFTAAAGADNTRFTLKYQKTLGTNAAAFNENTVTVFRNNGIVTVNSRNTAINNIKVYDVQGRLVAEQNNVNTTSASIRNLRAIHQVLIVKVTGMDNTIVTKKVVN